MSNAERLIDTWRHAAIYVDKILKGERRTEPFSSSKRTSRETASRLPEPVLRRRSAWFVASGSSAQPIQHQPSARSRLITRIQDNPRSFLAFGEKAKSGQCSKLPFLPCCSHEKIDHNVKLSLGGGLTFNRRLSRPPVYAEQRTIDDRIHRSVERRLEENRELFHMFCNRKANARMGRKSPVRAWQVGRSTAASNQTN